MNGNMTAGKVLTLLAIVTGGVIAAGAVMAATRKTIDVMAYAHSGFDS
jgi:hypothetical protein